MVKYLEKNYPVIYSDSASWPFRPVFHLFHPEDWYYRPYSLMVRLAIDALRPAAYSFQISTVFDFVGKL